MMDDKSLTPKTRFGKRRGWEVQHLMLKHQTKRLKLSVALLKEDRVRVTKQIQKTDDRNNFLEAEVERLRGALQKIAEGEGRYSRDPLEHASNTIEDMQMLALAALEGP